MRLSWHNVVRSGSRRTVVLAAVAAFVLGFIIRGCMTTGGQPPSGRDDRLLQEPDAEFWTCSMHPQIRQPESGQCPLCGMDLVPVAGGTAGDKAGSTQLKLSPAAVKLAEIQVAPVERKFVTAEIRMVGKVEYDETRLGYITAWVPGRIDRMFVDYTGMPVNTGDHMIELYSPELLTAQQELIEELKAAKSTGRPAWLELVRDKLRLLGLTQRQIDEIEDRGTPSDHMTIYAPMSGIVIHKNGFEGLYVNKGTRIYTIADLSRVWIKLDAYESDLMWIRYGQQVAFETEAYPGELFTGRISFIDPVLNAKTRTVKVRVNVPNADGRLKPEMFVRASVHAKVAAGGKVMDAALAGKWISPMHPEIVKDEPGVCDVCGMPLVRAESLGYAAIDPAQIEAPLVIPASAPLITGKRAVVYIATPGRNGVYEGREVVLGARAGDYYIVRDGLAEGEMAVVNGNFKIDSAVQIMAKPSMMNPKGGGTPTGHQHGDMEHAGHQQAAPVIEPSAYDTPAEFKKQLDTVFSAYFEIQQALSHDNLESANAGTQKLARALDGVDMGLLTSPAHMAWMKYVKDLEKSVESAGNGKSIEQVRSSFALISESLAAAAERFGTGGTQPIIRFHCPMAFGGRGADWLQNKAGAENPYFGAAMFSCGQQTETIVEGKLS